MGDGGGASVAVTSERQLRLCDVRVDECALDDVSRTVLEAIDKTGSITARQAGEIAYRFRRFEILLTVPRPWLVDAGRRVIAKLERAGLVEGRRGRWRRCAA